MGYGGADRRRALSRESDGLFERAACEADGAVLVSFWHLSGMAAESGTPTEWLKTLSDRLANVICVCPSALAAERYFHRDRHPGHLDGSASEQEILARIQ
jgi:hypothetical protein